ncbi:MAG: LacI family DNA-binding transcriptional regulator [Alicyclobacillaceae bacterium]|nr:LacI family DNA-binding transcriptional regulator [Alicyclobacillaceae bacterium]
MTSRREVARQAKVSPTTVSRVTNGNGYVSPEARRRVLDAVRDLNYFPNKTARSLRMQSSMEIACITHNIVNPFYGEMVLGIEEVAVRHGYSLSIYIENFDERDYQRMFHENSYEGLIVLSPVELNRVLGLSELKEVLPTVVYWDWSGESPLSAVTVDLRTAMRQLTNHLIVRGHRDIVFLGHETMTPEENPRYLGYLDAHAERGLSVSSENVQLVEGWHDSSTDGYQFLRKVLQRHSPFTAVAASTDMLAIGAMKALSEFGLRVPEDVSVVGCDNLELSALVTPSLTTVNIPRRAIGRALMNALLNKLGNSSEAYETQFDTTLVLRDSVRTVPRVAMEE